MGNRVVTFEDNGVDKISDYSDNDKTDKEICELMHASSYRKNLVKQLKEQVKGRSLDEMTDNSLGYELEQLIKNKRIYSSISNIKFHRDRSIKNFGVKM
jgi:hypothetical protein